MRTSALEITWPETHFTIQDIQNEHPMAKNITIRFRINRAIEDNKIVLIGKNPTSVGRPTIVFHKNPITDTVLKQAVKDGVILEEAFEEQVVKVAKVSTPTVETTTPTVYSTERVTA